jgi:hypothetical protein
MAEEPGSGPTSEDTVVNLDAARKTRDQKPSEEQQLRELYNRTMEGINRHHCVVCDHGTTWILYETDNPLRPGFRNVYRLTAPHFRLLYQDKRLSLMVPAPTKTDPDATKKVTRCWADWWLEWEKRRTFYDVAFAPGQTLDRRVYNLWPGWAVEPLKPRASAGWPLLQQHLLHVVCSGNRIWFDFLLNCLADMVQRPGQVGQIAIVLRGGEGIGKGIFGSYLMKIFGPCGLHLTNSQHLQGRYNLHLQNCIFLLSDEAYYPGDKAFEGAMRGMITEEYLAIEAKYQNLFSAINCLHLLIISNNEWVVPMAIDARRFFPLDVLDLHRGDTAYFDALVRERDHGNGPAAMLWDLQHRNLRDFDIREVPDTPAGAKQRRLSLDTIKEYWVTSLERGYPFHGRHGVRALLDWRDVYTTEWLWNGYLEWCRDTNRQQRQTRAELCTLLGRLYPHARPRTPQPTHEVEAPLLGYRHADPDPAQGTLPIGFDERLLDDPEASSVGADAPLDDPAGVIVLRPNQHGYRVASLEEARARWDEIFPGVDTAWRKPIV